MKTRYAILPAIGLALMLCVSSVRADNPKGFPAYYNDNIVLLTLNTVAQGAAQQMVADNLAIPLYLVEGQVINHVISSAPGRAGYNPYWQVYVVTENDNSLGDMSQDPLKSVDEITHAASLGEVTVTPTPVVVVLCPAVSSSP